MKADQILWKACKMHKVQSWDWRCRAVRRVLCLAVSYVCRASDKSTCWIRLGLCIMWHNETCITAPCCDTHSSHMIRQVQFSNLTWWDGRYSITPSISCSGDNQMIIFSQHMWRWNLTSNNFHSTTLSNLMHIITLDLYSVNSHRLNLVSYRLNLVCRSSWLHNAPGAMVMEILYLRKVIPVL